MSGRIQVSDVEDLQPGERTILDVDGVSIGVLNVDGEYYAISNTCPHRGGPVCKGMINGRIVADLDEPGSRVTERISEDPTITCPWHGWEYELSSGTHIGNPDITLPTYPVSVEDGTIYLERE